LLKQGKLLKNKFFLIITTIMFSCTSNNDHPHFSRTLSDLKPLNGHWYLYQKIIPEIKSRDSIYPIDSSTYQGKRITIDVEKMLFSMELYPYNALVSKYRMIISQDSLKVKAGAFHEGEPIYKNSFTFMLSENTEHLRIYNIDEKGLEIYHKR
tara:strand:- start:3560 stop:4018 length:459 start_codon:yes stop_codon:yes gene_type:complete